MCATINFLPTTPQLWITYTFEQRKLRHSGLVLPTLGNIKFGTQVARLNEIIGKPSWSKSNGTISPSIMGPYYLHGVTFTETYVLWTPTSRTEILQRHTCRIDGITRKPSLYIQYITKSPIFFCSIYDGQSAVTLPWRQESCAITSEIMAGQFRELRVGAYNKSYDLSHPLDNTYCNKIDVAQRNDI